MADNNFSNPMFFINSTTLAGVLTKGEIENNLQTLYITNEKGQFPVFAYGDYIIKAIDDVQDQSFVFLECSIRQFPNGHYLCAQSINITASVFAGNVIRVEEPKVVNDRTVINFALAQSTGKDDKGTIIDCAYWYDPNKSLVNVKKLVKGNHLTVSGTMKVGSYTKEGVEIPTIKIDVRHIASGRSNASNGILPTTMPSFKPAAPKAPVTPAGSPATSPDPEF
jgi:hypothetical protein